MEDKALQDLLLKVKEVEVSPYFESRLKINIENVNKDTSKAASPFWIAVPAFMSLLIVCISIFFVSTTALYAENRNISKDVAGKLVVKAFAGSVFSPANFAIFCNQCGIEMCGCCNAGGRKKCIYGGCKNGN